MGEDSQGNVLLGQGQYSQMVRFSHGVRTPAVSWVWGGASHATLSMSPKPLKSLSGIPLVQITAGGDHSFALSLSGAVFGWGKNTAGQLGLGDTNRRAPAPVDCLNLKKTVLISCGGEHTAVLTKGGVVFTFGSGHYGQLGHNSLRDELRPRVVGQLCGFKVTQIACGRHHTLAFVRPSNKIYSFGRGEQGLLGNGVKIDQSVPLPVQLPGDCWSALKPSLMTKHIGVWKKALSVILRRKHSTHL
ncbi:probable E3 ubiquitin-protein ligase HERC3 [Oncorhynchus tshawytscha]|uniref:probable E3 ubiquitin-protein ligase HERC3 n=1 Tax=Oncorhynchus tshawytscha TaxID=74940 RepID=UPI001C3C721C|nr:probable E3 ubiquitin-protein ligase HERC3 [Oncorhynchus tshawytscha]XP_042168035.1 probable E3 ubiquitin-protein ligase HERC3 [Oncorhynchus tshawytscha]XP_042168036.1 probable E3 ubiquitin-protein ligase HERC3 [Oncorhynchus tshawytscha]